MTASTPEETEVLGPRILAQVIDNVLNGALIYGGLAFAFVDERLALLVILLGVIVALGHYLLAEAFWDGQTLGKHALDIKVVRTDGTPCSVGRSIVRNLLQIVDVLPTLWLLGMVSIALTERNQRIGDLVAGTVVVKDPGAE